MKTKTYVKGVAALCALAAVACTGVQQSRGDVAVYLDESQPLEKRVEDALSRLTLEEKVGLLHAQSKFSSAGVPRLGIPEVWCTDGPHGIRPEVLWDEWDQAGWTNDSCTAFPALTCLAATWNPEMSALYGKSIGEEARYRDKDVLLGPGVNIYRTPLNGRNFEYMGEDPFLSARMVVPYVQGVQQNGVAACVKHFAVNNQELRRHEVDVVVDDRALHAALTYPLAFDDPVRRGEVNGPALFMRERFELRAEEPHHVVARRDDVGFGGARSGDATAEFGRGEQHAGAPESQTADHPQTGGLLRADTRKRSAVSGKQRFGALFILGKQGEQFPVGQRIDATRRHLIGYRLHSEML